MNKPSLQLELILSQVLKYPTGALFCLERYNGVDEKNRLVLHIIDCAKKIDGTQLECSCIQIIFNYIK